MRRHVVSSTVERSLAPCSSPSSASAHLLGAASRSRRCGSCVPRISRMGPSRRLQTERRGLKPPERPGRLWTLRVSSVPSRSVQTAPIRRSMWGGRVGESSGPDDRPLPSVSPGSPSARRQRHAYWRRRHRHPVTYMAAATKPLGDRSRGIVATDVGGAGKMPVRIFGARSGQVPRAGGVTAPSTRRSVS